MEVTTLSKVCFPLIYIFFEFVLMSRIDGIGSCLEDYILLFLLGGCMDRWMDGWMDGWMDRQTDGMDG